MNTSGVLVQNDKLVQIYEIRGEKVMLDSDLAELYGIPTKVLNQAVSRNLERSPRDFMFQLSHKEYANLKSQFVTSSSESYGGKRKLPFVFAEHGILMLSSVLRSERAVKVNIQIMRSFVAMRESLSNYKQLKQKLDEMEDKYDEQFKHVFQAINEMLETEARQPKRQLGFKMD